MQRFIITVGFFFVLACGGRTELGASTMSEGGAPDQAAPAPDAAILVPECAPNDGPALAIIIAPSASCDSPLAAISLGTTLHFYGPTLPGDIGTYAIGDGAPAAGSGATVCDSSGCAEATNGTLTITEQKFAETEVVRISGTYTLVLGDGTTRSGAFVANVCQGAAVQCG